MRSFFPSTRVARRPAVRGALATSFAVAGLGLALLTPSTRAAAEPLAMFGGDAINLQADELDVDVLAGEAVLTGKVSFSKGELAISCPRVDLRFDHSPHVTWVKGSGGVVADVKGVHAESPQVEFDLSKQVLEMHGGVKLSRGQGWLTADTARIDVSTGKVQLTQVKGAVPVPAKRL